MPKVVITIEDVDPKTGEMEFLADYGPQGFDAQSHAHQHGNLLVKRMDELGKQIELRRGPGLLSEAEIARLFQEADSFLASGEQTETVEAEPLPGVAPLIGEGGEFSGAGASVSFEADANTDGGTL